MLPVKFGLNCEHIFVSRLLHKVKCQTITKKRQTSDYLKKNIKKITKDIVICLSHFIINKLPICYSVEKKTPQYYGTYNL